MDPKRRRSRRKIEKPEHQIKWEKKKKDFFSEFIWINSFHLIISYSFQLKCLSFWLDVVDFYFWCPYVDANAYAMNYKHKLLNAICNERAHRICVFIQLYFIRRTVYTISMCVCMQTGNRNQTNPIIDSERIQKFFFYFFLFIYVLSIRL